MRGAGLFHLVPCMWGERVHARPGKDSAHGLCNRGGFWEREIDSDDGHAVRARCGFLACGESLRWARCFVGILETGPSSTAAFVFVLVVGEG